jgi:ribonuclease-3
MRNDDAAPLTLDDEVLARCEGVLQYSFRDRSLLVRGLTHASAARVRLESNERLEFLGDSVLGAVVCEELFHRFPNSPEGELTRIKSVVVSRTTCARIARAMNLSEFLVLGKGITVHRRIPQSVLAAAFEAIVGAMYLDSGYEGAREFLLRVVADDIEGAAECLTGINHKSLLQQRVQRELGATPTYRVLDETGPDHLKCFQVCAVVGTRVFPPAWGASKKEAEQFAAQNAIAELDETPATPVVE